MRYVSLVAFLTTLFFIPEYAAAQNFVPCTGPDCEMCHLVEMGNRILGWLIIVLTVVAGIVFAVAGLKLVTSGGNPAAKDAAKSMFVNVIVGFLLVLASWLIIDTLMKMLVDDSAIGPWNEISCVGQPALADVDWAIPSVDGALGPVGIIGPDGEIIDLDGAETRGGGSCDVIDDPDNPCHPDNLQGTCFAGRAQDASRVCNQESGGNQELISGTDRCADGRSFSGGTWQINILAHGDEIGCDTSSFQTTGSGPQGDCARYTTNSQGVRYCARWNCRFTDEAAYESCMQRTFDQNISNDFACDLYESRGFDPWRITANHCGVAI